MAINVQKSLFNIAHEQKKKTVIMKKYLDPINANFLWIT